MKIKLPKIPRIRKDPIILSAGDQKLLRNFQKEQAKLEKEFKKLKEFHEYGTADSENAQEIGEFSDQVGLQKKVKEGLENIKNAIKKLERGKYGICESCKKNIAPARLAVNPIAIYCVSCQTKNAEKNATKRKWIKLPWMK